jgi:NAD(P)-dependent dehydrogenase (short-subunit alcohol dehydrogenase family)
VKRFFTLVRETLQHKAMNVLVASGLGGNFGCYRADSGVLSAGFGQGAGLAGMIKSLAKEFPDIRAHWVDLDLAEPAADLANCLEMELLAETNDITEVAYQTGQRRCMQIVRTELSLIQDIDNLDLDEKSVVLLTGGARGITARIAIALAKRFRCHFELVGRSAAPRDAEEAPATRHARDRKSLRQAVIAANPGMRPADVEKTCAQIQAERDMRDTFARIHEAGGSVTYTQLDVREIESFTALIQSLYEKHGRIDGVVHGAGVVEDKLVRHKTSESFQRVFDTKVRGALMLYKLIRDDVKFVVFFSSVAGAFGNKGQVDYASANDVLDKLAHALQARVRGRVLSVNWGPWADTGMVSAELEREYARKGIGLIPLNAGVDALLRELSFGHKDDTQVVLMCGTPDSFGATTARQF